MRTLDDVVDALGVSAGQYAVVLFGGELYSGLIKTLVTVSSTSFAHDLGFSSFERGWLVSMLFLGNFLGNLISGAMSDYCGRRKTLLTGYAIALVALSVTLLTSSLTSMLLCRTSFGLAAGVMGPTCWTLLGEISPSKKRMLMHSLGHSTWYLGGMAMLLLVHFEDPSMHHLPWRGFTAFTLGVMVLCALGAMYFVVESPSYLSLRGRRDDAIEVLETLRSRNGVQTDVHDWEQRQIEAQSDTRSWSYSALFTRSSIFTTLTLCMCTFSLNYGSYGMMYALPIILRKSNFDIVPSVTMMLNLCFGLAGMALSLPASAASHSRVSLLSVSMLARAVCCLLFLTGLWHDSNEPAMVALTLCGLFGKTLLDGICYCLVYLYAIEVRGTESRASSSGMALAVGRLGGVLAPVFFETFDAPKSFVLSVAALALVCAGFVLGLPIETKDRQLGDIAAESVPLPK